MELRGDVRTLNGARHNGRESLARAILDLESSDEFSVEQLVSLALKALRVRSDGALQSNVTTPHRLFEAVNGSKLLKPQLAILRPIRPAIRSSGRIDDENTASRRGRPHPRAVQDRKIPEQNQPDPTKAEKCSQSRCSADVEDGRQAVDHLLGAIL